MKNIQLLLCILVASLLNARAPHNPHAGDTTIPKWTVGGQLYGGYGVSEGLTFGYYDVVTGYPIYVDPGASFGASITGYRHIKSIWIAGAQFGFSNANSLSGVYDNITSTIKRGVVAEVNGGMLLFSKFRHRLLMTVGPVMYSGPTIYLNIADPDGPGDAIFHYKPSFGVAFNANYILILKRIPGQFTFGLTYHQLNFKLESFETGGEKYTPDQLNPAHGNFKNPDGSNLGVVVFGYQYTFN